MKKRIRPIVVALAVVACLALAAVIAFPQFAAIDPSTRRGRALRLENESDAVWLLTESRGVENVLPVPGSNAVYASDLSGYVTRFDGTGRASLAITATRKVGDYALGLAYGGNGTVFAATSAGGEAGWLEGRTSILALGENLDERASFAVALPCLNGIAVDGRGGLWLASSNFSFARPEGTISYLADYNVRALAGTGADADTDTDASQTSDVRGLLVTVATGGLFNGLCARADGTVLAADTLSSIFALSPSDAERAAAAGKPIATRPLSPLALYRKASFAEAFDDVCGDSRGRVWSANPLTKGRIAVYDPAKRERRAVELPHFGYASSCRVRVEDSREILYVSELRSPDGTGFDGRGIIAFPIDALVEVDR